MVGAGVLALPYSFSYLTWGGGLVCLAACTVLSLYCSHLLADFHELPDGTRLNRYRDLGRSVLGKMVKLCLHHHPCDKRWAIPGDLRTGRGGKIENAGD